MEDAEDRAALLASDQPVDAATMGDPNQSQRESHPTSRQEPLSWYLIGCVMLCGMASTLLGYDVGIITGAKVLSPLASPLVYVMSQPPLIDN